MCSPSPTDELVPPSSEGEAFNWRSNATHHAAQEKMGQLEGYYEWVLDLFGGVPAAPIADAGAGSGHLATILSDRGAGPLLLLEGGEENLALLRARFSATPTIEVIDCDLTSCRDAIQAADTRSIISMDVLEHLPDDLHLLREFYGALPSGGKLFIKVPALNWLYGPVDEASGHYRRYSRRSLRDTLEQAGFVVERCRYMNMAGVPPYFLKSRVLRRRSNFSRTFSEKQLRRIARAIPFIRRMDRLLGPPLGLSVVAVALKR